MRVAKFLAVVLTALALVPGGAHLFALPNKIALTDEPYFIVQGIYRGWALFGIVLFAAIAANGLVALMQYRRRERWGYAAGAVMAILVTLAIFFTWTFPANQATANWTQIPSGWESLRLQWEYSHAVNAVVTFFALCLSALAAMAPERR